MIEWDEKGIAVVRNHIQLSCLLLFVIDVIERQATLYVESILIFKTIQRERITLQITDTLPFRTGNSLSFFADTGCSPRLLQIGFITKTFIGGSWLVVQGTKGRHQDPTGSTPKKFHDSGDGSYEDYTNSCSRYAAYISADDA